MNESERQEFEKMKADLAMLKRGISIDSGRIILEMPIIVRGTANINGITIFTGNGDPGGTVANVGSLYLRLDGSSGTTLYVKESGTDGSGWSSTA